MNNDLMFSSKSEMWETPQAFFDDLNNLFQFTLDACATPENAKCERYFTPEMDGLKQEWDGVVWCNPPYGRGVGAWVEKAHRTAEESDATVVMLLPARTDTAWFHDYCYNDKYATINFVRGRLKFGGEKNSAAFQGSTGIMSVTTKETTAHGHVFYTAEKDAYICPSCGWQNKEG